MKRGAAIVVIGAVVVALVLAMSVYTIDQRKAAIRFRLGEVRAVQTELWRQGASLRQELKAA